MRQTSRPPNILLLLTDKHAAHVAGFADDTVVRTQHLDALATRGVQFDTAICASPVCTPSRMRLLTVKESHRCGARNNHWVICPISVSRRGRPREGLNVTGEHEQGHFNQHCLLDFFLGNTVVPIACRDNASLFIQSPDGIFSFGKELDRPGRDRTPKASLKHGAPHRLLRDRSSPEGNAISHDEPEMPCMEHFHGTICGTASTNVSTTTTSFPPSFESCISASLPYPVRTRIKPAP